MGRQYLISTTCPSQFSYYEKPYNILKNKKEIDTFITINSYINENKKALEDENNISYMNHQFPKQYYQYSQQCPPKKKVYIDLTKEDSHTEIIKEQKNDISNNQQNLNIYNGDFEEKHQSMITLQRKKTHREKEKKRRYDIKSFIIKIRDILSLNHIKITKKMILKYAINFIIDNTQNQVNSKKEGILVTNSLITNELVQKLRIGLNCIQKLTYKIDEIQDLQCKRRKEENLYIENLRKIVPTNYNKNKHLKCITILENTYNYIRYLKNINN